MSAAQNPGVQRLLWSRVTWRHAAKAPWTTAFLVLTLALGVAVFLSIRLANRAAVSSFQNFTDIVTAESDGILSAPSGSLPESILGELRQAFPGAPVHWVPVMESTAVEPGDSRQGKIGGRSMYQILGVDWIAMQNLASARRLQLPASSANVGKSADTATNSNTDGGWIQRLADPRAVLVTAALAADLKPGVTSLRLVLQDEQVELRVAGVIPELPDRPRPPRSFLLMDLPALQALTGRVGKLDRIEFVVPEGPDRASRVEELRRGLETLARGRWTVSTPSDRRASASTMTQAFRLNLSILSLLALLVGLMLVFQALDGAVVRRREEIAILRSLGITQSQILRAWLLEALVLGIAGGSLGIVLGWAGAQGAVRGVAETVNSLYFATAVRSASLDPIEAAVALMLSVGASLVAGWWPARLAAETPPAQMLGAGRSQKAAVIPQWVLPGSVGLLLIGALLTQFPALRLSGGYRISLAAYGTAIAWLLGFGLLGGVLTPRMFGRLSTWGGFSAPWRLALSQLRRPTGRHRLAIAGLVCAVSMTSAMAILVGSFDTTLRGWIERTFMADLYVSSEAVQGASPQNRIAPEVWRALAARPEVAAINVIQTAEVQLPQGSTLLFGASLVFQRDQARIAWRQAPLDDAVWDTNRNAGLALASESFSERFQLHRGDTVALPTPSGPRRVTLAGIFSDYGNERGSIVIQREQFQEWYHEELASSLIAKLHASDTASTVREQWKAAHPGLAVYTQPHLRGEALRIFRQTFAITDSLEFIGVAVSILGLGFTLASLLLERRAELTTLRSLGFRRGEIALATAIESLMTALAGVVVGGASSVGLGWLLIYRVNVQTYGWTLEFDPPWRWIAALSVAVVAMAVATGWGVGRWGADLPSERTE